MAIIENKQQPLHERVRELVNRLQQEHDKAFGRKPDGSWTGEVDTAALSELEGRLMPLARMLPDVLEVLELAASGVDSLEEVTRTGKQPANLWQACVFAQDRIKFTQAAVLRKILEA